MNLQKTKKIQTAYDEYYFLHKTVVEALAGKPLSFFEGNGAGITVIISNVLSRFFSRECKTLYIAEVIYPLIRSWPCLHHIYELDALVLEPMYAYSGHTEPRAYLLLQFIIKELKIKMEAFEAYGE